jgi:hypothetical protein
MSTYQVIQNGSGVRAIERDETKAVVSIQTFPTQLAARQWVLARVDASVAAEQAAIRGQILRLRTAA